MEGYPLHWPGKESTSCIISHHHSLLPHHTDRDGSLLTAARDEDLHGAAEGSHSSSGDSSHPDRAGGVGGHHGQDNPAGVVPGFSGAVLLESAREEPELGEAEVGRPGDAWNIVPVSSFCLASLP